MIQHVAVKPDDNLWEYLLRLQTKLNEVIDALNKLEDRQGSDAMARALSDAPDGRL